MNTSVDNGTVVHGWCGFVEKSNKVLYQQMVLNKLWIPDDMINEIKDYLYISAAEVLRKFYRSNVNRSITDLTLTSNYLIDVYGRQRIVHWATGHTYGGGDIQFQDMMCVTCGDFTGMHDNENGCCALSFDEEGEPLYLVDDDSVDDDLGTIPEVTWDINVPVSNFIYTDAQQAQFVLTTLQKAQEEYDEYDREAEAADYAEYMREVEMEMYLNR